MPTPAEFRYDQWVQRAKQFTESLGERVAGEVEAQVILDPPLAASAVDMLSGDIGRPIPAALQSFLINGAGGMQFSYHWTASEGRAAAIKSIYKVKDYVWGGGVLCKASDFREWLRDCKEWAEETWVAEYPDDFAFWTQSFPILMMDTADFLGLDGRQPADDPAVVYLSHGDESKIIAPTFTAFLAVWERLRYVGPDIQLLRAYFDEDGMLSADTDTAKILIGAFENAG